MIRIIDTKKVCLNTDACLSLSDPSLWATDSLISHLPLAVGYFNSLTDILETVYFLCKNVIPCPLVLQTNRNSGTSKVILGSNCPVIRFTWCSLLHPSAERACRRNPGLGFSSLRTIYFRFTTIAAPRAFNWSVARLCVLVSPRPQSFFSSLFFRSTT